MGLTCCYKMAVFLHFIQFTAGVSTMSLLCYHSSHCKTLCVTVTMYFQNYFYIMLLTVHYIWHCRDYIPFRHWDSCICCYLEWYERTRRKTVQWEGRMHTSSALPFDGIPYMVIGRMVLQCAAGTPRKRKTPTSLVWPTFCAVFSLCVYMR